MENPENPAKRLIALFGSSSGVGRHFKISGAAARLWLKDGIPTDRALEVEEKTAGTEHAISAIEVLRYAKAREEATAAPNGSPAASPA